MTTYGLSASITARSMGRPSTYSGWFMMYWFAGVSSPTSTTSDSRSRRPARPDCWKKDASVPG